MPGLILDSSTNTLILALSDGDKPLFQIWDDAPRMGPQLFSLITLFLEKHEIERDSLSFIAVGRGPGSYTGTRAAVAAATGFAMGAEIPLIHFPSLLAFLPPTQPSTALLEVKGSKDLFGLFFTDDKITEKTIPLEELASELSLVQAVTCAQGLIPFPHDPPLFLPEVAIPRITAWITEHMQQPKKDNLVYLRPIN